MRPIVSVLAALVMLIASVSVVGAQFEPAEPQEGCDYFDATQHNLCEPFLSYWNANGGLEVFGYPKSEAFDELNEDLGVELLTQYFERERLEHHPANAGTEYEILLGRLGAEILGLLEVNWFEFPKDDPSSPNYFAETGFSVPDEFYAFWSSHGLDLGDEGMSFRESLALFGYPISPLATETNSSGDTVPTQWFERARFELHENGVVLLGLLGNELLDLREGPPGPPPPPGEVVAEGLDNPRHLKVDEDGAVYVAEAGATGDECVATDPGDPENTICVGPSGGVTRVLDGEQTEVVSGLASLGGPDGSFATGPHDLVIEEDGTLSVLMGLGAPAVLRDQLGQQIPIAVYLGTLASVNGAGELTVLADLAAWEEENNPDGQSDFEEGADSNPYGVAMMDDGSYVVADAGGNTLLHVALDGTITPIAVFPTRMVPIPPEFQEPGGPTELPMHPVPTSVVQGPDGAWYVGELTGFPFPVDGANVYRVTAEGEVTVYASGFTNIVDIAFDAHGNLYVVEMAKNGLLAAETAGPDDIEAVTGALIMVAPDGTHTELASEGLILPGGVAIGPDGTIYVTNFSTFPGMGQVLALEGAEPPPPPPPPTGEVIADGLDAPRGIDVTADGSVYVAETAFGGEDCVVLPPEEEGGEELEFCFGDTGNILMIDESGTVTPVVPDGLTSLLTPFGDPAGVHDVIVGDDGVLRVIVGLGADPAVRTEFGDLAGYLGYLLELSSAGVVFGELDISGWESTENPDGSHVDSNPFGVTEAADGADLIVSDSGANALLHVNAEGVISTLAVFESRMVEAPDGSQIPMESVPTGVTTGPDGAYYVGELTGFPYPPGTARVWRVAADGTAEVYAEGFTNIIDVAFDADGNLYVLEMIAGGLTNANPDDPATAASRVTRVAPNGAQQVVLDVNAGLIFATGLAVGPDGALYVSNFGVMPGMGQVVRYDLAE